MSTGEADDVSRPPSGPPDGLTRLWAPWRSDYVTAGAPIDGCPFCVLPGRPPERDRESLLLHRGTSAYVIFNAYPYNPGHLMVVPYAHVDDLAGLTDEAGQELWALTRRCVEVVRERLSVDGVNVGMNLGVAAGAGIATHLHQHVVPRWNGDTNFMSVVGSTRVLPQALASTYEVLADAFA